jgi:hypothetical protein
LNKMQIPIAKKCNDNPFFSIISIYSAVIIFIPPHQYH